MSSIEKAKEALEKTRSKVLKLEQKVERLSKKVEGITDEWEKRWAMGDLGRAQDELRAAKKTLEKRYAALEKAKNEESEMAEFSEEVLQMIEHVVDITFEDLTKARDKNKELYYASRGDDDKAYKMYKRLSEFDRKLMWMSDDEILNYSKIAGKEFALDLINRTKAIVGNVTNWEHLHYGVAGLDGVVYGDKGKASVNTIVAGGYNIQRRHYRVLVKAIK